MSDLTNRDNAVDAMLDIATAAGDMSFLLDKKELITTALSVWVGINMMIKGWGLAPESYGWIIGGALFTSFLAWFIVSINSVILKDED